MSINKNFRVHPNVLKLGLVSFLTDVSLEMIFSVFAVFFITIAGASSSLPGHVEGLADFSTSSLGMSRVGYRIGPGNTRSLLLPAIISQRRPSHSTHLPFRDDLGLFPRD